MYWFSDADERAAKATMVSFMDQGYPWHEAASMAGLNLEFVSPAAMEAKTCSIVILSRRCETIAHRSIR